MPSTSRMTLEAMLKAHGPLIRRAFLNAVADAVNGATFKTIAAALARADYDLVIDVLGLTPEAFETVAEAVNDAYRASGRVIGNWISGVSTADIQFQFKTGNPIAAEWMRAKSSTLVAEISQTQRAMVREALEAGMEAGLNPRTVALDIAGRIPKGANQRTGGLVGLTKRQARTVQKIKTDFKRADPAAMRAYLKLQLRDRRFDRKVMKAIREGIGLSRADIDAIARRYADKALKWRADNIARTEATQAFHAAQDHAFDQAVEKGFVAADKVTKTWRSARDDRTRFSHKILNGQKQPKDGIFISPMGSMMKHPGDRSLGASAADTAQCRCRMTYTVDTTADAEPDLDQQFA